jgi:hypothetical protein
LDQAERSRRSFTGTGKGHSRTLETGNARSLAALERILRGAALESLTRTQVVPRDQREWFYTIWLTERRSKASKAAASMFGVFADPTRLHKPRPFGDGLMLQGGALVQLLLAPQPALMRPLVDLWRTRFVDGQQRGLCFFSVLATAQQVVHRKLARLLAACEHPLPQTNVDPIQANRVFRPVPDARMASVDGGV